MHPRRGVSPSLSTLINAEGYSFRSACRSVSGSVCGWRGVVTASEHVGIRTLFTSFRKQLSLETINTRKFLLYSNVLDELAPPEIRSRGAIVKERPASFATRAGHARSKGGHEGGMNAYRVHFDGLLLLFNATRTLSGPPSTRASIAMAGGVSV